MIDVGILVTGIAAIVAFGWGQGRWRGRGKWLRHLLLLSWAAIVLASLVEASMSTVVFTMVVADLAIAGTALAIVTHDPTRTDAKVVGGISMALMPAHWIVAATHGSVDWTLYAAGVNAMFVLQCLIVRGWLDGMGRGLGRFFARLRLVHLFRSGGQ